MQKVLLVTIQDNKNFGNRLQNYALQHIIEDLGYDVVNLDVMKKLNKDVGLSIKGHVKGFLYLLGIKKYAANSLLYRRKHAGDIFTKKHIHNMLHKRVDDLKRVDWSGFSNAVVGSDQVWHNWHRIPDELDYFYLQFIDKRKRISYASSFGFTEFPEVDLDLHYKYLNDMHYLSCREREGCKLIKTLTGRDALKVLDPTLLLDAGSWEKIEIEPHFQMPQKYLLVFFLSKTSLEYDSEINRIADQRRLEIVNINNKNDVRHYAYSPSEFVWLIHHADTICTDSFHASVFSIIFGRNLRVFHRIAPSMGNMFGRLDDLLSQLGLNDNVFGEGEGISTIISDEVKVLLDSERNKSIDYLINSLNEH